MYANLNFRLLQIIDTKEVECSKIYFGYIVSFTLNFDSKLEIYVYIYPLQV